MFRKKTEIAHLHISDNWLIKSHWTFSSHILSIIIPGTDISWSPHRSRHWLLSYPQHHHLASTFLWCSLLLWLIFVIIPKSIWSSFQQSDSNSCKITYAICCETVFCFCHWKSIVSHSPGSITSYLKTKHNIKHIKSTVLHVHDKTPEIYCFYICKPTTTISFRLEHSKIIYL